ncbi:MAG: hypothetical protein QGF16_16100, partial [Rhodospirillales bacterium]|nr:hypothetical protein [Rhodospirillales bacterium]
MLNFKYLVRPSVNPGRLRRLAGAADLCAVLLLLASAAGAQNKPANIAELNKQLFLAVKNNQAARVRSLLTAGADPIATNKLGMTPAGLAIERGYFQMAHYILAVRNQRNQAKLRAAERLRRTASPPPAPASPPPKPAVQTAPRLSSEPPPARLATPRLATPRPATQDGRNPFDPLATAQSAPPTFTALPAEAPKPAATPKTTANDADTVSSNANSEAGGRPGIFGRVFGGIVGVFDSDTPAIPPKKTLATATAEPAPEASPPPTRGAEIPPMPKPAETKKARPEDRAVPPAPRLDTVDVVARQPDGAASTPTPVQVTQADPVAEPVAVPVARPSGLNSAPDTPSSAEVGSEPGFFGRMFGGIAGVFGNDAAPAGPPQKPAPVTGAETEVTTEPLPPPPSPSETVAALPEPSTETAATERPGKDANAAQNRDDAEPGFFGRVMKGIANVAGADAEAPAEPTDDGGAVKTAAGPKTGAKEPPPAAAGDKSEKEDAEKTDETPTVISSFFKNIFAKAETGEPAPAPAPAPDGPKVNIGEDAGAQPEPEIPEIIVRSDGRAGAPMPASPPGPAPTAEPAPSPAAPPPAVSPAPSHADTPPPAPALQASATATANDTPGPDK